MYLASTLSWNPSLSGILFGLKNKKHGYSGNSLHLAGELRIRV